jgi:hypothetical protein
MLVTFSSTATDSITLFGDVAVTLIKMMGNTGRVPSAIGADEVPDALHRLESAIERIRVQLHAEPAAPPAMNEDWGSDDQKDQADDQDREPPVDLATRAVPLIALLKRAAGAHAPVMWK